MMTGHGKKKPRKTQAEKRAEWARAEATEWDRFQEEFAKINTVPEAQMLVARAVPPDTPGRRFYSNFGWFMMTFRPPNGANGAELMMYLKLLRHFTKTGQVKQGTLEEIEEAFHEAWTR